MNRRLLALAALPAAATLVLSGCGSSGNGSGGSGGNGGGGGNTTLQLVAADYGTGPSNTSKKYWDGIASDFHAQNPNITVKVNVINWNDIDDQVKTMVQNHNYPDVLEGNYYSSYAQEGLLYPAKDVFSGLANIIPAFKGGDTYKGTQYGIPFTTSSRTLFYNKKLFQQAGISSAPQNWNDIKTDALKIKRLGKIGFGLPLGSEEAQAESLLWMLGNGGGYTDKSGNWTIDSSQNVQTFDFLKQLVQSGATEPNPGTKNRTDLWKQFAQNQIGMINGSPALIPIIQQGGVLKSSDWASVPIPGKTGPLSTTLGVYDNVSAFKAGGTSKQAAIKKFIDFAYQDKYQVQFDKEYDLLPATSSALNQLKSDPALGPFLKALPNATQYPISNTAWPNVLAAIQHTIGTAISGNPQSVLSDIQSIAKKGS